MESKELRIGNITDKGTVVSFWESGIHVGMGKTYKFSECSPIPLTHPWLLKFGFVENSSSWTNWKTGVGIKELRLKKQHGIFFYNGRHIYDVHQLQNLFSALTGEELTIDTP